MNTVPNAKVASQGKQEWTGIASHAEEQTEFEIVGSAQAWFDGGERALYDPITKAVIPPDQGNDSTGLIHVFHRVEAGPHLGSDPRWTTFLPGFPDGSYGWARVDHLLGREVTPRLFVEFVGQGDSDKPADYPYSIVERADLVEAQWRAHNIESTFAVAFDYSVMVVLELLSRQQERIEAGVSPVTDIQGVLLANGGLFADSHSHPWQTTPLLKTPMGRVGTWFAQRSRAVFYQMVGDLYSKEYAVTSDELEELYQAIARRDGAAFMSKAAGFVDEHQANAERWNFARVFRAARGSVSFHIAGSTADPFEGQQIGAARERLGPDGLDIRVLPGGHLTTAEHPDLLAELVRELTTNTQTQGGHHV